MLTEQKKKAQEYIEPQLDWVLLRKISHEDRTESGIVIPTLGDIDRDWLKTEQAMKGAMPSAPTKHHAETTGRYEVLAVGPGDFVDYSDDTGKQVFLRKPMQVKVGETVIARAGVREIFVNGETLYLAQDFSLIARVSTTEGPYGKELEIFGMLHDYVAARPATLDTVSAGGISLVHDEDFTGNQRFGGERYAAMGVGEGAFCLRHEPGKPPGFARRPLPVESGDTFCAHGVGFGVALKGTLFTILQAFQIAGVFKQEAALS